MVKRFWLSFLILLLMFLILVLSRILGCDAEVRVFLKFESAAADIASTMLARLFLVPFLSFCLSVSSKLLACAFIGWEFMLAISCDAVSVVELLSFEF